MMTIKNTPMIRLKDLQFSYGETQLAFDLSVQIGEILAITGVSGVGKSTLLNLIAGFELADSGEIWLNGENHTLTQPHQRPVSMLFQEHNLFDHLSVWNNLGLGLNARLKLNTEQVTKLKHIAEKTGLSNFLKRLPEQLSGGQKQRVALARCLLREQPILLLDEPFSALDKPLRQEMLALVKQFSQEKKLTVLLVTHQPEEIANVVSRRLHL